MSGWKSIHRRYCPVTGAKNRFSITHDQNAIIVYGTHTHTNSDWHYVGPSSNGGELYVRKRERTHPTRMRDREVIQYHEEERPPRAPPEILHLVYDTLFFLCGLSSNHKRHVTLRKLPVETNKLQLASLTDGRGGGRWKLVDQLIEYTNLPLEELLGVPGLALNKKGFLTLSGAAGMLMPLYDHEGRIVAVQIRRDQDLGKGRYRFLSAKKGARSGAPVGVMPRQGPFSGRVGITEGFFKAVCVESILSPEDATLYLPGAGLVRQTIERCKQMGAKKAELFFDSDMFINPSVFASVSSLARALLTEGIEVIVWSWDRKKGKGIDDLFANGGGVEDLVSLDLEGLLRAGGKADTSQYLHTKKGRYALLPYYEEVIKTSHDPDEKDLRAKTKEALVEKLREPLGSMTVIAGATGSCKSYFSAKYAPPGSILVLPTYAKIAETASLLDKLKRDYKIVFGRSRRPQESEEDDPLLMKRWETAGCERYEVASALGNRLHSPCEGCPLRPKEGKETACKYWKHLFAIETKEGDKKKRPELLLMLPETFFSSPIVGRLLGQNQLDLDGKGGYHNIFFDDIEAIDEKLARLVTLRYDDAQQWIESLPAELTATRAFIEEVAAVLFNPARSMQRLYELAWEASAELKTHEGPLFSTPLLEPDVPLRSTLCICW